MAIDKWDQRFLDIAQTIASWSRDPDKKVGCVAADDDHNQLSGGYNGFPRNVADDYRLLSREFKLNIIVHAEANTVATAARNGHSLKGSTVYVTHPPCSQCASLLIQAGVKRVVYVKGEQDSKWAYNAQLASSLMTEAGLDVLEIPLDFELAPDRRD